MVPAGKNRKRSPAGIFVTVFLLVSWIDQAVLGEGLPFEAIIDLPGIDASGKVEKGAPFGFLFCLHTLDAEIAQVEMALVLPPEVDRLGGETAWKGDLPPREQQCLDVGLRSRTGMEKWSRPIQAEMKFIYQGMRISREVHWNGHGFEDTDFVSK